MFVLAQETADDRHEVEALFDLAFAPGREALSSYRLRDGVDPVSVVVINRSLPGVLPLMPTGGFTFAFVHPGGSLTGLSVYLQTIISTATAANGIFAGQMGNDVRPRRRPSAKTDPDGDN